MAKKLLAWVLALSLLMTCFSGIALVTAAEEAEPAFSLACIRGAADKTRAFLAARLIPDAYRNDPRAQVLSALVLGDKSYSEPETVDTFKRGV